MDVTPSVTSQASTTEPPSDPQGHGGTRLAVQIWLGISGLFAVLALAVALSLAGVIGSYQALRHVAQLSAAEREAVAIGVAAREQYMHQSHGALLRDEKHLGHERQWADALERHANALRPMVGEAQRAQLDTIEAQSTALSNIFTHEILPAAIAGDLARVRKAHGAAEHRVDAMIGASNTSVAELAGRNRDASEYALKLAYRMSVAAVATTLLAGTIAVLLAITFVRRMLSPVAALNAAAARIGEGDFDAEAPPTRTVEFEELRRGLKHMADRLRDRERKLLQAERLATLGTVAAGVAHELNNPLGVILGYLRTVGRRPESAPLRDELRILEEEAQQCRTIVRDLVTFAREPRLDRRRIELVSVVREVCERLRISGELGDVAVVITDAAEATVDADEVRIGQVVRNLVLNAVAASRPHFPVELSIERRDGIASIVVRDRGRGIEAADVPHVFEPFFSRHPGGSGLGLAVSHGIVRSHGGTIDVESRAGEGTTVTVRLPAPPESR